MLEDATHWLGNILTSNDSLLAVRPEDEVLDYVTKTGVHVKFLNPGWILEFDTEIAKSVSYWRFVLVDLVRIFTLLLCCRYALQFFGNINPYDGGFFEVLYTFTQPYTRAFLGILPNIFGIDAGVYFSFYLLDRLDTILITIAIIDHTGKRF